MIAILARLQDDDELLILAGLRKIAGKVEQEVRTVPTLNSILDHEVLGREFGPFLNRLIEKRFGTLPGWAQDRLTTRSAADLEALST